MECCIQCNKPLAFQQFICSDCKQCQKNSRYFQQQIQINQDYRKQKCKKQIICPQCTYKNLYDSFQCIICKYFFQHKLNDILFVPKRVERISSTLNCPKCKFQNHISNQYCLNCQQELFQHIKKKCPICSFLVKEQNYIKHHEECLLSKELIEKEQIQKQFKQIEEMKLIKEIENQHFIKEIEKAHSIKEIPALSVSSKPAKLKHYPYDKGIKIIKPIMPMKPEMKSGIIKGIFGFIGGVKAPFSDSKTSCYYCNQKFASSQFQNHLEVCQKKAQWRRNMQESYSRLTPLQTKAVMHMHQKSQKQHQSVRTSLEDRVSKLGYSNEDLDNLRYYIQNYAPIIIQIHVSRHMEFFVKDTHYRNQFQTNKSSGSLSRASRTQWQDRMFDNKYNIATDFQRVKYGVINFTNDPKGVQCAKSYGPSYFLLKSNVRDRCTFTDKDSSSPDASIATLKYGYIIVSKMNDKQLTAAFIASKALEQSSGVTVTYKQLQIHGPIEFAKDIERIYVSKDEIKGQKKLLDLVYQFSQKFGVEHDFF